MKRFLVFVLIAASISAWFIPNDAFGCSRAFSIEPFLPYTTYLHADCTEDIGHLSWTGLIMIILAICAGIIIIKKQLNFSRKFYLLIIPAVFICILMYSIVIYGTADLTEFFLPHDFHGDLDHLHHAQQLVSSDFDGMLAKRGVEFHSENMFVTFNHDEYTREQYRDGEFELPYDYCGIAIADDHTEYWYSATYNDKKILTSTFYEENPVTCDDDDETCFCQATRIQRDHFKFRP
jgi:hypothetical protein